MQKSIKAWAAFDTYLSFFHASPISTYLASVSGIAFKVVSLWTITSSKKEIPTLYGNIILEIKAGTQNYTKLKIKGKGIKLPNKISKGDMYAVVNIITPTKLDRKQKALLQDLAQTDLEDAPEDYIVRGPNRLSALPMEVPVSYQEIAHCLDKSISKIEIAVLGALEQTPPELYADIVRNGIYLAGGGALLKGLDKRLQDKINIPFHIAEDPLRAVARGTGIALKNVDNYSFLLR